MDEREESPIRRRSRVRAVVLGFFVILLAAVLLVWLQRRQIASDFIERELARRGVQATYDVKQIGFRTQRLENVVIGDPERPDAVAESVELDLSLGFREPRVDMIRARGVLLRGRIADGRLSLGEIDKLLPPPSGAPFRFPDQAIDLADTAIALDTPYGRLGLAVEGKGNLADGFRGEIAGSSSRLMAEGCAIERPRLFAKVKIDDRTPTLSGPLSAALFLCPDAGVRVERPRVALDLTVPESFDKWRGRANLAAASARINGNRFNSLRGSLSFGGNEGLTRGELDLAAGQSRASGFTAAGLNVDGRYSFSPGGRLFFTGDARARAVSGGTGSAKPISDALRSARGSPGGPIADALANAVDGAATSFDATGKITVTDASGSGAVRLERLQVASRSGARLSLSHGDGVTYYWPAGRARVDGNIRLSGGGFPLTQLSLEQRRAGAPISGIARIAPMSAGDARLQLADVRFTAGGGGTTRIDTTASIDGPFEDGRVEGLLVPVSGRFGGGGFMLGEDCTPVSFRSLRAAGLRLGSARLGLCPTGRALVWRNPGGEVQGGARIRAPRLSGQLGQSPIAFAADEARFSLSDRSFASSGLQVRLGPDNSVNRFDADSLSGRFAGPGVSGDFAGGNVKLANVPLLMSGARGSWRVRDGDVIVDGGLTVSDEMDPARFYPLVTDDFRLTLIDNQIAAKGTLADPEKGVRVAEANINHSLRTGRGNAVIDVPGIRFTEGYQPEDLTRLTLGVIALVDGTLRGRGEITWSPEGSASTGTFSTEDMDFAAAFGPVEGLTTTIRFTNLLGLETAPGQVAEIDLIRTGIEVFDGLIRYRLLPGQRVLVEGGRWPFAGGILLLDETILDFSQPSTTRRLVFRVIGLDAARFIQQMEFSNIAATGTFDGVIPMVFDQSGGRIVDGLLEARPPGGTLSYIGELTDEDLGTYGKLAFDALKSLRYTKFTIGLNGKLDGEFVAAIELDGVARDPVLTTIDTGGGISGLVARRALSQLAKIPFEFNITISGPFRALIATARSFEDPSNLIQSVLPPELLDSSAFPPVQPEESETVR